MNIVYIYIHSLIFQIIKKFLTLSLGILLLGIFSCSKDVQVAETDADAGIQPFVSLPILMHYMGYFSDNGYSMTVAPQTDEEVIIHKTVFAAAVGRWLAAGQFGERDSYSGAYHSWRTFNLLSYGSGITPWAASGDLSEPESSAAATRAIESDPILSQGNYYKAIMEVVRAGEYFTTTDDDDFQGEIFAAVYQAVPGSSMNMLRLLLEMEANSEIFLPCLTIDNFTISRGIEEMKKTTPATNTRATCSTFWVCVPKL